MPDTSLVSPDGSALDARHIQRPGVDEIQFDSFGSYASNVALYPDFHTYFRTHQTRLLAIWSRNDPFTLPTGATSRAPRSVSSTRGIATLETRAEGIAEAIASFFRACRDRLRGPEVA